jgi:hypothetical protein
VFDVSKMAVGVLHGSILLCILSQLPLQHGNPLQFYSALITFYCCKCGRVLLL